MSTLVRFGVSIEKELLDKFDAVIRKKNYPTRSKAIEDLLRHEISQNELLSENASIIGSIDIVYDHHRRELLSRLTDIQHDFQDVILSSQHIHLDHHNCFEIIIVKGDKKNIEKLADAVKSAKGVKHSTLSIASVKE